MRELNLTERRDELIPVTRAELESLRSLAPFVTVHPAWKRGHALVKAPGYVGEAHPPGLRVTVTPKFPASVVATLAELATEGGVAATDRSDWRTSLGGVYAARLARLIEARFAEGRLRDYREAPEVAQSVRGRIDFAELARRNPAAVGLPTIADEFTADRRENQAVVAAGRWLLGRAAMRDDARGLLAAAVGRYGGVEAVTPTEAEWAGLLAGAKTPARVAVLEWSRAALAGRGAGNSGVWFRLELAFQQAVTDQFRAALAERAAVESPHISLTSPHDPPLLLKPDLVVRANSGRVHAVFDVKWKHLPESGPSPRDLQQVLAYQRALGGVPGGLLYPGVGGAQRQYALPGGGSVAIGRLELGCGAGFLDQCAWFARRFLPGECDGLRV